MKLQAVELGEDEAGGCEQQADAHLDLLPRGSFHADPIGTSSAGLELPHSKVCTGCDIERPLTAFHGDSNGKYGKRKRCKSCEGLRLSLWRAANREREKERNARWYAANKDKARAYEQGKPREYRRVRDANRGARQWEAEASLTLVEWHNTLRLYDYRCAYCGDAFTCLDHVVPLCRGGASTMDNCVPCCTPCNGSKARRLLHEWDK